MKLDWLELPSYRNLRDFRINFDETQPTTVLLGRNGSGKSNLIEAIVEIFRDLELGQASAFTYKLQYLCRGRTVVVATAARDGVRKLEIVLDTKKIPLTEFERRKNELLPSYVFAYYSGWSGRLEALFESSTRSFYDAVLKSKGDILPLRRLFFCRREYSQLVLLAFFLTKSAGAKQILRDYLRIADFDSALFVLKRPWWGSTVGAKSNGNRRFWGARGAFNSFLDALWTSSLAPLRREEDIPRDVRRRKESVERLYLYIKNADALKKAVAGAATVAETFGFLESMFLCDLIDEVRVSVRREDGEMVRFAQLSEGEQQLLTVLGLIHFTQHDEALYLLDEPDTHLNPVWTYEYLQLLQESIRAEKGQLLIATHNPLMVGSLHRNQVRVLAPNGTRSVAKEPEYDPVGIGVEGLLKSELYGLRTTLAPEVTRKLDRHYLLLGKARRSNAEGLELMRLASELGALGIARSHPNPYFDQFAAAMSKRVVKPDVPRTAHDVQEEQRISEEIIASIVEKDSLAKARS